jgi:hypothetical protein
MPPSLLMLILGATPQSGLMPGADFFLGKPNIIVSYQTRGRSGFRQRHVARGERAEWKRWTGLMPYRRGLALRANGLAGRKAAGSGQARCGKEGGRVESAATASLPFR